MNTDGGARHLDVKIQAELDKLQDSEPNRIMYHPQDVTRDYLARLSRVHQEQ